MIVASTPRRFILRFLCPAIASCLAVSPLGRLHSEKTRADASEVLDCRIELTTARKGFDWVTVTEWMQPEGVEKHGSDNSIYVAKIQWNRPNRLSAPRE